jgi:hypothetical protein
LALIPAGLVVLMTSWIQEPGWVDTNPYLKLYRRVRGAGGWGGEHESKHWTVKGIKI